MKPIQDMKAIKTLILTMSLGLMPSIAVADCTYELFTISSAKGTTINSFIDQITDECQYSVLVTDKDAEKILNQPMNKTNIKNMTINEVLDFVLKENNLAYTLKNRILRISYLQTKTYHMDYIASQRKGTGSTDITLSSSSNNNNNRSGGASRGGSGAASSGTQQRQASSKSNSGIKIESSDEVVFWDHLDQELQSVLNRPEDPYKAAPPLVNKNAGLITVTATAKQIARLDAYMKMLQNKMKYQVLIDVHMLGVTFSDTKSTGIDWAQLYALQNLKVNIDALSYKNVTKFETDGTITEGGLNPPGLNSSSLIKISGGGSLNEVIKFLKTQGDVYSISNPKVLTLNNQPALITVGTEYFYKIRQSTNQQGTGGGVAATTQNDQINSVFAGVLLDITPEISSDDTITLKINPSVSQTRDDVSSAASDSLGRTIPPDLDRRQLSSVVTVKDGNRIILGGLISSKVSNKASKVPLLGDIPGLSYFFKYEEKVKEVEELVIIIQPHIIRKENNNISLKDLGYEGITNEMVNLPAKIDKVSNAQ